MVIEIGANVGLVRASDTIFLDTPPSGYVEKVIQDFQFGLSDLHLLSVFYSFFFWYCNPEPRWPQMILHVKEKWSAASVDDWKSTDWFRCLLLFVSLAVLCDLLRWQEHWGWGLFTGAKRQCRFCHLQKVTQCLHRANGKSANQQQLVMNATLTEPKRPANNTSLTAADNSS